MTQQDNVLTIAEVIADLQRLQDIPHHVAERSLTSYKIHLNKQSITESSEFSSTHPTGEKKNPVSNLIDEAHEDIKRVKSMIAQAETRENIKQAGDTCLIRAKNRVDSITGKYKIIQMNEQTDEFLSSPS